jgi:Flp pilus assembly protein TadG
MKKGLFGRRRGFQTWGERGQALVEFSLVSIAFFFLTFGVFDLARLFQSWETVQHASRESARYAITGRSDCNGAATRDNCIIWTAKHATSGLSNGGDNAVSPNVIVETRAWDYDLTSQSWPGAGSASFTGKACDQIEVTVTYKHKFILPVIQAIAPNGIDVVGRQRMTNEPYQPCVDEDGV